MNKPPKNVLKKAKEILEIQKQRRLCIDANICHTCGKELQSIRLNNEPRIICPYNSHHYNKLDWDRVDDEDDFE